MLKGIPKILSPELLKVLCEMGHGDRLVSSDGNFPAQSVGKNAIVIRCDGHGVPEILDAILTLLPLASQLEEAEIRTAQVPFEGAYRDEMISGMMVLAPDLEKNRKMLEAFLNGKE